MGEVGLVDMMVGSESVGVLYRTVLGSSEVATDVVIDIG